ncbi:Variant-specific surface protein [Giardia duodenalis assemblage B]|uniref:Variant-specific surface protein n=1 Tax=Giardia duodenalis assemblage B TaxID=1394984 RepID=A0A132NSN3_GIAIN|nr:Variant-specific surface protein [Giardia intestinalis assemblage B]
MLAIYLAVGVLAAACSRNAQANCVENECATVGATVVCMNCQAGHVPVDGNCVAKATNDDDITAAGCTKSDGGTADQTCGKCGANYFLFQGGCYKVGQEPGSLVCTDALGSNTDKPGVCKACAEGYFTNTQATETQESCVACGDENCATCTAGTDTNKCTRCAEGYFVGAANNAEGPCVSCSSTSAGSGGWTGVTGCAKCTKPASAGAATCTECNTELYLKTLTGDTPTTSCVTAESCGEGFFATTVGSVKKCVPCGDATNGVDGCEKCTAPSEPTNKPTCTKCTTPNYLKTAADGTTTCVEKTACKNDFFPKEDNSNGHKCLSCGDETSGVPNCAKCTAPSSAGQKPACSECGSGFRLEGGACVSASTNKSALSTGAIAGIFITAVVVMGGLVDFFSRAARL